MRSGRVAPKKSIATGYALEDVLEELRSQRNSKAVQGMARYGIETSKAFGIPLPQLRDISRRIGRNHDLALRLWDTGIREARIVAGMIDDASQVSQAQMEKWVLDFDSWDVVDGTCGNLFDKTPFAVGKAHEWARRKGEYVKRAGFVLMAELSVHNKKESDKTFLDFLPIIVREANDERNFVKKAINWALRQIGKRNLDLNAAALQVCKQIQKIESKSARWIAADALRELTSPAVQKRLIGSRKSTSPMKVE